jgi:hypothetical protein
MVNNLVERLQQEVQYEVRQANKNYMEDVSTDYKENSKKFWSFIKSKGQEWTGVAPLKNKMGFLQSDNKSKAVSISPVLWYFSCVNRCLKYVCQDWS